MNHHPDIEIRFTKVPLKRTTHDEGGITGKEFSRARQCEEASSKSLCVVINADWDPRP